MEKHTKSEILQQIIFDLIIDRNPLSVRTLITEYGQSVRNAKYLLKALKESPFGEYLETLENSGKEKRYVLSEKFRHDILNISSENYINYFLGKCFCSNLKLSALFEEEEKSLFEQKLFDKKFFLKVFPLKISKDFLLNYEAVNNAVINSKKLRILYKNAIDEKSYIVRPYTLFINNGTPYLRGYLEELKKLRLMRLDRILKIEPLDESFTYPKNYSPEKGFENSWGIDTRGKTEEVILKVHNEILDYIKAREWHKSDEFSKIDDTYTQLKLKIKLSPDFINWLFGWGENIIVLSPNKLVMIIKKKIKQMNQNYE